MRVSECLWPRGAGWCPGVGRDASPLTRGCAFPSPRVPGVVVACVLAVGVFPAGWWLAFALASAAGEGVARLEGVLPFVVAGRYGRGRAGTGRERLAWWDQGGTGRGGLLRGGMALACRARRPLRSSSAAVAAGYGVGRYGMGWPGTGCNGTGRHGPGRYGAAWPQGRLSWARLGRESVSPGWVLRDGTVRVAAVLRDGTGWGGGGRDGPGRCGAGGGGMVSSGFEPGLLVGGLRLGAEWD